MLFKFILQMLIMFALGAIVYLMARAMPRVSETDTTTPTGPVVPHWLMIYVEKLDELLLSIFEKILRKFRLFIMKFDNIISKKLNKFKKEPIREIPLTNGEKKEDAGGNTPSAA